jgi:Uma2 family endonuclease
MATSTNAVMVPLEEYLHTSYEHGCEWVDGQLKGRGMPDGYHGYFQDFFMAYFRAMRMEFGLRGLSEVRMRVSSRSYRIPDVMAIPVDAPFLPYPVVTPSICVEILSTDDRVIDLQEKIDDYVALGVGAIWIVDPRRRTMSTADAAGIHKVVEFQVPGGQACITAGELFAELDELERLK